MTAERPEDSPIGRDGKVRLNVVMRPGNGADNALPGRDESVVLLFPRQRRSPANRAAGRARDPAAESTDCRQTPARLAPPGRPRENVGHTRSSGRPFMTNASHRPSGEIEALCSIGGTLSAASSARRTRIHDVQPVDPSGSDAWKIRRPSGVHADGLESMPSSTTGVSRSAAVTSFRKTSKSPLRMVVKASRRPSGCHVGFQFIPSRSSDVSMPRARSASRRESRPPSRVARAAWSPRGESATSTYGRTGRGTRGRGAGRRDPDELVTRERTVPAGTPACRSRKQRQVAASHRPDRARSRPPGRRPRSPEVRTVFRSNGTT